MNYPFVRLIKTITATFGFFILASIHSASANTITLSPVATLDIEHQNTWQQIIANPSRNDSYFLISDKGNFHFLEKGQLDSTPFFELTQISERASQLTAAAIHPNFALRDQVGFHVLYTAHIEPIDSGKRFNKIQDAEVTPTFDVIVNEWTMTNKLAVDISSKREVIRIGVASQAAHITKLAFSPFTKVWNDDFGLLYLALNQDKQNNSLPLYSGAILRINPEKFGLRNYTIPNDNPFVNRDEINNELLIIGLQEFKSFIWPKKNNDQFIANHKYGDEYLLSLIKPKADFRSIAPSTVLYRHDNAITGNNLIAYRGRQLAHLWGATLFLSNHEEKQWQMQSLILPSHHNEVRAPALEWQYQGENYNDNGPLSLFEDNKQELLVLNQANQQLSRAILTKTAGSKINESPEDEAESSQESAFESLTLLSVGAMLLFLLWIGYLNRKKGISARYIVRQQYGNFEMSESQQQISLFRRHQKTADIILELTDITECHVLLNKVNLKTIKKEHAFNNDSENDLREQFNKERREKMVPNKIRQLNIELTDNQGNHYPICIYLRKGDNRITRKKFGDAIEQTLNWCWTFSSSIAPDSTEVRLHKPIEVEEKVSTHLFDPANFAKPSVPAATDINSENTPEELTKPEEKTASVAPTKDKSLIADAESVNNSPPAEDNHHTTDSSPNTHTNVDTNLINALEKLAQLKAQNALTEQEFERAKQKVLQGLLK